MPETDLRLPALLRAWDSARTATGMDKLLMDSTSPVAELFLKNFLTALDLDKTVVLGNFRGPSVRSDPIGSVLFPLIAANEAQRCRRCHQLPCECHRETFGRIAD